MHQILDRVAGAKAQADIPLGFMDARGDFQQLRYPTRGEQRLLADAGWDLYSETHPKEVTI